MAQIGTIGIRYNGAVKKCRVYDLNDTNVAWKGFRVKLANGQIGCLNAVTDGTNDTGISIRSAGGTVRRVKTYSYSQYEDVVYQQNYPGWTWQGTTENFYYGSSYYYLSPAVYSQTWNRVYRGKFGLQFYSSNAGSINYININHALYVYDNGWYNTGLYVYPTALDQWFYLDTTLPWERNITKFTFVPQREYPGTNWTWAFDNPNISYKVNELVYH